MNNDSVPVLSVNSLGLSFSMYQRGLRKQRLDVIRSLDLSVNAGEIVAVVGSSGSGKSLLAHAILGILPRNAEVSGEIRYNGEILTPRLQQELRGKEIVLIPQSVDFLDPLMRVGRQVARTRGERSAVRGVFARYGLDANTERMYPFQLSGGMARRVLISTAVLDEPRLIVADEPTPGLSPDLAMETLGHFRELADNGAAVLLITHDIDLALPIADKISVFYAGTTVETALASDFSSGSSTLRHPYTRAFMDALPQNGLIPIPGTQPYAGDTPKGCVFAPRCAMRTDECSGNIETRKLRGGEVKCCHAT